MAVGTSFKQECPSCEAMVLVKDASMIGKKIECPKCKDRFAVVKPSVKKPADDEDEEETPAPKPKAKGKPAPQVKKAAPKPVEEEEEADEFEEEAEEEEEAPKAKPGKGKKEEEAKPQKKTKDAKKDAKAAKSEEEGDKKKGKKKGLTLGSKKLKLGLGLAVVGLLVLAAAAYFILFSGPSPRPIASGPSKGGGGPITPPPFQPKDTKGDGKETKSDGKEKKEDKKPETPKKEDKEEAVPELPLVAAGPELTNLLPPDTEQVVRLGAKNLLENDGPFREAAFHAGAFTDAGLRKKIGFAPLNIDEIILAEKFTPPAWSFAIIHVWDNLNIKEMTTALGLKAEPPIKEQAWFKMKETPWLNQLSALAPGLPPPMRALLPRRDNRPLYLYKQNHQTLIVGDQQPVQAFLEAEGQFRYFADKDDKKDPKKEEPKKEEAPRGATYMTIKPALKNLLDRQQPKEDDPNKDRLLFVAATEMAAAVAPFKVPDDKSRVLYRPRPFWDITCLLEERQTRLNYLGSVLTRKEKEPRKYQYRTELVCRQDTEAKELVKDLIEKSLPRAAKFLEQVFGLSVEVPGLNARPNPTAPQFNLTQMDATINMSLEVDLDAAAYVRFTELLGLLMIDAHAELALVDGPAGRHRLARAAYQAAVKGQEGAFLPGSFPPGSFPRPSARDRGGRDPAQRISWMAALLPHLGHDRLFKKIQFESSWRDPINWMAGRTMVPEFLDPSYPDAARHVSYAEIPVEMAATHFVGISGVGLEAGDYPPGDPAFVTRRGILGFEGSVSIKDVQAGRGLANTVLLVQVPHDSIVGPTPWIAGGGATLRGVPEKNSIDPFVLGRDQNNKAIQYNGRSGTYVLMADGSVRFVTGGAASKNVSDEVFKSMCTYKGPTIDITNDENIPVVVESRLPETKAKEVPKKTP